ncbi:MAG: LytTR family DNA-binding domain-containing protein, partial [Bacteroidota bacterium]|nr:LytTR family DNA-binding domain-containing protein [Bacteroidota bacterium]
GNVRDMIPFYDEKSVLKLSVKKENLLYLESEENYVSICYLNKGKISKYLLRDTLKRMEENFTGTEIVRCHRSYMVNFEKVRVIRKDKEGLKLELDYPSVMDIPVSKTYVDNVMQTFSRYSRLSDL